MKNIFVIPINVILWLAFESGQENSWTVAESTCQSFGADLVSLLDEGEKNFVYEKVINRRSYDYYWIGLNNIANSNSYEWISTQNTDQPSFRLLIMKIF